MTKKAVILLMMGLAIAVVLSGCASSGDVWVHRDDVPTCIGTEVLLPVQRGASRWRCAALHTVIRL